MNFNTNTNTILYKTLARALSMKRPHNSEGTQRLTDWLDEHARKLPNAKIARDAAGNLHVDTRLNSSNRTLFVAHVDTVHRQPGPNKIRKTATHWHADGAPLGADDGAGVAMLMHLMYAGIPAYYVFTQGEECGGIGATWLADNCKHILGEFDRAIAFDRRGIDSVITHQAGGRCCSDVFADALSAALNADDTLMYLPDDSGVYTDTAEFTHIIPECTNISVGYYREHSEEENLDVTHLQALAERCALIDWDKLPTERDPSKVESKWDMYDRWGYSSGTHWSDYYGADTLDDTEFLREDLRDALYDAMAGSKRWLVEMICESVYPEDPDLAARFIDTRKLDDDVLEEALSNMTVLDPDAVMADVFDRAYTA